MKYLHSIPDHMMYLGMVCVRLRLMSHPDVYDRILSFRELPSTRGIRKCPLEPVTMVGFS
jgi:hypothetical protein